MTTQNSNVQITDSASSQISKLLLEEEQGARLRIVVEAGGCNGFQYKFDFDKSKNNDDIILAKNGAEVIFDEMSLEYMQNAVIDYKISLGGEHFEINNPNVSSSCGCGNSFAV